MGSLKDEVFEKLDYLSQLTEVIIAPQNEILAELPDRVELTLDQINSIKNSNWNGGFRLEVYHALCQFVPESKWDKGRQLVKYFSLESSPDFQVDFLNGTMIGSLFLVKTIQHIEDKELLSLAVSDTCEYLNSYSWKGKKAGEKIVTVLNTIEPGRGTTWWTTLATKQGSVPYQGAREISKVINEIILDNKWRIRDVNVILKLGQWINSYISDTTDTDLGLVNLMKLKIMLDKDLPIYSIDEVKNAKPK